MSALYPELVSAIVTHPSVALAYRDLIVSLPPDPTISPITAAGGAA